jgi:hypothetical protein
MKKLLCVVMLGAVWGLWGCSAATDGPGVDEGNGSTEQAASANACHYKCNKCPPNQICALYCVQSGNCDNACVQTMLCIQGYHFDQKSCQCMPDSNGGGGQPCGNGNCGAGEYCCNSSCGICAPIGGVCPMIACTAT